MQMAKYSDDEILSSNLSLGICPGLNMWCLYELTEEKKVTCYDEFYKVFVNVVIIAPRECTAGFRVLHVHWEGESFTHFFLPRQVSRRVLSKLEFIHAQVQEGNPNIV